MGEQGACLRRVKGKAMDEDRTIALLVELHRGLARLGPGDDATTRRALAACEPRPRRPRILDIGAGTGAQSLCLARACEGQVVAVDRFAEFVVELARRATACDLAGRIAPCVADMGRLPFPAASFDIAWCEGAAYLLGFDDALERWHPLVRPGDLARCTSGATSLFNLPARGTRKRKGILHRVGAAGVCCVLPAV